MESSLFLVGNTSSNGPFSMAMLVYWSVILPYRDDSEIPSENNHGNGEYMEYPPNKMHECPPYQGTYCSKEISSEPTIHIQGIQLHHFGFQEGKIRTYLLCHIQFLFQHIFSFQTQGMSNRKTSVRTHSNPMSLNTVQKHPMKRCSMHIDKYKIKYFVFRSCLAGD